MSTVETTLEIGTEVRILAPFNESFRDTYFITEVVLHDDGQVAYILGDCGGFDPKYLEVVWQ